MRKLAVDQADTTSRDALCESAQIRTVSRPRLKVRDLDYYLMSPRGRATPRMHAAYRMWHRVWSDTLGELDGTSYLGSDEFTRQDEISALFWGEICISVTAIRWLDLSSPMFLNDSYFRLWPAEVMSQLRGRLVGIVSNAAIAEAFRGGRVDGNIDGFELPLALKDLTVALPLLRLLESKAALFVAVARNDRAMNRVTNELGSRLIGQVVLHGIRSDIVSWSRTDVSEPSPLALELWRRRRRSGGE